MARRCRHGRAAGASIAVTVAVLLYAGCGGGGPGSLEDALPSAPTYNTSGNVTGDTLSDVTGVQINLSGAKTTSTTTSAGGHYSFSGLRNGSYTATPTKTGYTFSPTSRQITVSGSNVTGIDFSQTPATNPSGQAYLYVPYAVFKQGQPPATSGRSSALQITSATPSGNLAMDSTVVWTVTWPPTNTTVDCVDLYIPEIGGYFEYPVDPADAADGQVQISMTESSTRPSNFLGCAGSGSQHGWWCYSTAPSGTTDDTSLTLIGTGGDVGQPLGGIGITWGSNSVCGNGTCESGESFVNCPNDCRPVCGNGTCESGETSSNCPADCHPVCGNGTCESGESSSNCPADCHPVCGNGTCESGENSSSCPADCGSPSGTCGGSGSTYCSASTTNCGVTVKSCANSGAGWYVVNGSTTYCCASTSNCSGAAQTVANIIAAACAQ